MRPGAVEGCDGLDDNAGGSTAIAAANPLLTTVGVGNNFGYAWDLRLAGDVDADGQPDLLARNTSYDSHAVFEGAGTLQGQFGPVTWAASYAHLGVDVDGDGWSEVLVANAGNVGLWDGVWNFWSPGQSRTFASRQVLFEGSADCACGAALEAGDLDGDGAVDVVIGCPGGLYRGGIVHVVPGPIWAAAVDAAIAAGSDTVLDATDAIFSLSGPGIIASAIDPTTLTGDNVGYSLAVGDWNGDGADDLAVGAVQAGVVYVALQP